MFASETKDLLICPKTGQPDDARVAAEPGPLPFGVVAGALLGIRDGGGQIASAIQMEGGLAVAHRHSGSRLHYLDK